MTLEWVPSKYLRKYSLPLAEEPNKLERHRVSVRGQFSGASMSSIDALIEPAASAFCNVGGGVRCLAGCYRGLGLICEIQGIDIELGVERHPSQPCGLGDGVCGVHAREVTFSQR